MNRSPVFGWRHGRWMLVLTTALALGLAGCGRPNAKPGRTPSKLPPVRVVQTVLAAPRSLNRTITTLGALVAYDQAVLSAKVPGQIETLEVDLGSRVTAGALLARIEPRDYQLRVEQAEAALAQARAQLGLSTAGSDQVDPETTSTVKQAQAVLRETQASFERVSKLSADGILSLSEVDTASAEYNVALNRYQDALNEVRHRLAVLAQRRTELEIAKKQLADTTLTAPYDGSIQERRAHRGEYLKAGDPVVSLVRLNPLRLRLEIGERDAPRIRAGQAVRLTVEGDTNCYAGEIRRISPALQEPNRVLIVEADVPNPGTLRPGTFAQAEIVTSDPVSVLTVPRNALVTFAGLEKVWAVENGKAVEHRVATGERGPDWIEVLSGLAAGTPVILNPGQLQAGQPITVAR